MTYFFHFCTCLCLIIFQTTVMPHFALFDRFYDLLFPFVVYLTLFRPVREGIPVILFFGFLMDNLSGGPLGLYLTTYLWLFVGIRWILSFLHVGDSVLLPFVVALGVLFQNLIFIGTIATLEPDSQFYSAAVSTVTVQVLWAIITGPILLVSFNYAQGKWERWTKQVFARITSVGL